MKNSHRQFLITSVLGILLLLDAPARLLAQPMELSVSPAEQSSPALRYQALADQFRAQPRGRRSDLPEAAASDKRRGLEAD